MNKIELAKMIDQTLLNPYATLEDLKHHCVKAAEYESLLQFTFAFLI